MPGVASMLDMSLDDMITEGDYGKAQRPRSGDARPAPFGGPPAGDRPPWGPLRRGADGRGAAGPGSSPRRRLSPDSRDVRDLREIRGNYLREGLERQRRAPRGAVVEDELHLLPVPERRRVGRAHAKGGGGHAGGSCRVFVGNLPYSASWKDLKDHMRQAGNVVHCDILAEPGTPFGSKGCGLVQFETAQEARRAVRELTETMLGGRPIFVRQDREAEDATLNGWAAGSGAHGARGGAGGCSVFVGNLPYSATWKELKDHMRAAGTVLHCDIIPELGTPMGSKGCGLVTYASPAEARRAIRQLSDTDLMGRPIFVREDREEEL